MTFSSNVKLVKPLFTSNYFRYTVSQVILNHLTSHIKYRNLRAVRPIFNLDTFSAEEACHSLCEKKWGEGQVSKEANARNNQIERTRKEAKVQFQKR